MEVFVVIIEDRHDDVEVEVYGDRDEAVREAEGIAHRLASGQEYPMDEMAGESLRLNEMRKNGWCALWIYNCEGDSVSVRRCRARLRRGQPSSS